MLAVLFVLKLRFCGTGLAHLGKGLLQYCLRFHHDCGGQDRQQFLLTINQIAFEFSLDIFCSIWQGFTFTLIKNRFRCLSDCTPSLRVSHLPLWVAQWSPRRSVLSGSPPAAPSLFCRSSLSDLTQSHGFSSL